MSRLLLITIGIAVGAFSDHYLVIISSRTPTILKESFQNFLTLDLNQLDNALIESLTEDPLIILDLTFDQSAFFMLDLIAFNIDVPYLTLTRPYDRNFSPLRFYALPSLIDEAGSLVKMIQYLKWKNFTIFLLSTQQNLQILDFILKSFSPHQIKVCAYTSEATYNELDNLVKRYLKVISTRNLLIIDEGRSLDLLIQILKNRKIGQYGKYFLFSFSSIYSINLEGSILLAPESVINSTSQESFYYLAIENTFKYLRSFDIETLKKKCPYSFCFNDIKIVNYRLGEKHVVGFIELEVFITDEVLLPGGNRDFHQEVDKTEIYVLIANGTSEPYGEPNNLTSSYYYGADLAISVANKELEYLNFE